MIFFKLCRVETQSVMNSLTLKWFHMFSYLYKPLSYQLTQKYNLWSIKGLQHHKNVLFEENVFPPQHSNTDQS